MKAKLLWLMVIGSSMLLVRPIFAEDWLWYVESGTGNGVDYYGSYHTCIASSAEFTDGYDGESQIILGDTPATYAAIFHENGDEWTGSTGFYKEDYVAPFAPGQIKTWRMYVWATPSVPVDCNTMGICFVNTIPGLPSDGYGMQFQLELISRPESVIGAPDVGTTWTITMPGSTISLPTYRTDNCLTGYQFELIATAVPEPASIFVILCGLAGIGGIAWWRRR